MSDPIRKWREEADAREVERVRVKHERLRAERRVREGEEAAALRVQFEARLYALEQHCRELQEALVESMRTTSDIFNRLGDQRVDLAAAQRDELRELKIEIARLGSTCAELRERHVEFKFAREKDGLLPPKLDS
jgi:hypothetical protein